MYLLFVRIFVSGLRIWSKGTERTYPGSSGGSGGGAGEGREEGGGWIVSEDTVVQPLLPFAGVWQCNGGNNE